MFQVIIAKYCTIPVSMVLAVIQVESAGNPSALSQGNYGLMQVRFATAKEMQCGVRVREDLFNPETNIRCGCNYLEKQFRRYRRWDAAVVAYNQGSVFSNGKIVLNYKGLDDEALKNIEHNQYKTKVFSGYTKYLGSSKP